MVSNIQIDAENALFRIDKFVVPKDVENVFLSKLQEIHAFVKQQPGCLKTRILRQVGETGEL